MRTMRVVLLAALTAVILSLILVTEGGASVRGPVTAGRQPGCAPVAAPYAQPPAWIPIAARVVTPPPGSEYRWMQPGCAALKTPYAQPPAWIPTG